MPETEPLVIACGADHNYAMPLAVTLRSALSRLNPTADVEVYIVDGGMGDDHRGKVEETVRSARSDVGVAWYRPDMHALHDLWVAGHVTAATYFSLLVPRAVPSDRRKAIYLDSDLLVEGDLADLWRVPFDGSPMMGVQDYLIPYLGWPGSPGSPGDPREAAGDPYVNAGVLVLDLEAWRKEGIAEQVFRYLREHAAELTFRDQEGLNAVLAGRVGLLHPRWNVSTSLLWLDRWPESPYKEQMRDLRPELMRAPGIWHFTGPSKPWHPGFTHPATVRWDEHRKNAGWPPPNGSFPIADLEAWLEAQSLDDREIASVLPRDASLILVSDSCRLPVSLGGRVALPFLERDGVFRGPPVDDVEAIRELNRMRHSGSSFIAFDRSTLWWLDHYRGFAEHLRTTHSCVHESGRVVVFEVGT